MGEDERSCAGVDRTKMKIRLYLLVFVVGAVFSGRGQTASPAGYSADELRALLRPGKVVVGVLGMSREQISPRYYQLSAKVAAAISKNPGLAEDSALLKDPAAFYGKLGLTKEEVEEFEQLATEFDKAGKLVVVERDTLVIRLKDQILSFAGQGKVALLASLTIDLRSGRIKYNDLILTCRHQYASKDSTSAPMKVEGFEYSYEEADTAANPAADPMKMSFRTVDLDLSKDVETGKTLLMLSDMNIQNGRANGVRTVACRFE
jgi:hypothetical protein